MGRSTIAMQKKREEAALAGKCIVCTKRKARAGKSTCGPCNDAATERVRIARAAKKSANVKS